MPPNQPPHAILCGSRAPPDLRNRDRARRRNAQRAGLVDGTDPARIRQAKRTAFARKARSTACGTIVEIDRRDHLDAVGDVARIRREFVFAVVPLAAGVQASFHKGLGLVFPGFVQEHVVAAAVIPVRRRVANAVPERHAVREREVALPLPCARQWIAIDIDGAGERPGRIGHRAAGDAADVGVVAAILHNSLPSLILPAGSIHLGEISRPLPARLRWSEVF